MNITTIILVVLVIGFVLGYVCSCYDTHRNIERFKNELEGKEN